MYSLTTLREIVRDHEETFNPNPGGSDFRKGPLVKFSNPTLVYNQFEAEDTWFATTKLKSPISSQGMLQFLQENQKWIRQEEGGNPEFVASGDNTDDIYMKLKLESLEGKFDADFVEFDDEFSRGTLGKTQLVYSVSVNRYVHLHAFLSHNVLNNLMDD